MFFLKKTAQIFNSYYELVCCLIYLNNIYDTHSKITQISQQKSNLSPNIQIQKRCSFINCRI